VAGTWRPCTHDPGHAIRATLTRQDSRLDQRADALLDEERVALGPLDHEPLERGERRVAPEQGVEQGLGALEGQGIDLELPVVGLAPPAVAVLRAVVHEEEHAGRGQALQQAVEQRLGLGVDPVQVLEQDHERLHLALAQEQALDAVEDTLAALGRIEACPGLVLDRDVEQPQDR